ncbi:FliH/SctL family protein [Thermovenabulum gondwanense]|uniref:Flagellar assembly protein FliH/Type III secretion system HrpE domain-containing protein n=1 Tax=Thermovenabulum gondwanense TaxID=520767 RepID=A0A162M9E9_9FIRM|nr:FliH/SctL family protein [Thermovenabulum gondwanense]KYO64589.1 hypothetical protein ATZ99_20250 [Thermovenabulum gondwanense]
MSKVLKRIVLYDNPVKLENGKTFLFEVHNRENLAELPVHQRQEDIIDPFEQEILKKQLIQSAEEEKERIISQAKKEAEEILTKAENEKEQILKSAYEKGFHEGYNKGIYEGRKKGEELFSVYLNQFKELEKNLFLDYQEKLEQIEKQALKLSLYIAEKILGKIIEIDGDYIKGLIEKGLKKAREDREILIRLSPSDYDILKDKLEQIKGETGYKKISIISDPTLQKGDLILENSGFTIDAGIKTQLNIIEKKLKEMELIYD